MKSPLTIALLALLVGGCQTSPNRSQDIYAFRLAVENLQQYTADAAESHHAELRGLRANQDRIAEDTDRRLESLEAKLERMEAILDDITRQLESGGLIANPTPVRRVLVLPPSTEMEREAATDILDEAPSPESVLTQPINATDETLP